ncbi:MAG TPA: Gfo/Idh/MocA family oxidoreductase [Candidatus Peribacteraceae bacterium]|nr:Gfo/Idh/MocA family oxidoreductase [Candidatus Peribacteraceae bacterium]
MSGASIGIVGLGYWGPNLLRNFAAHPGWTVKYGCDLEEKNLAKMKLHYPSVTFTTKLDDLLTDKDLTMIAVATPTRAHFPIAKAALEAGKHVLIEKPITETTAQAEELIALAKAKNLHVFVDHTFVFAPAVRKMRELYDAGTFGDLLYIDSTRINLGLIQSDVNVLYDLAIHDLSILGVFKNLDDIATVSAQASRHFGTQEEHAHLHLTFKDGVHATVNVSWLSPVKIRQTIIAGSKAMATYDDTEPSEKLRVYDRGIVRDLTKPDPMLPTYRSGDILIPALPVRETLAIEVEHILRCIQGAETPLVPGEEGRKILIILEKAQESLAQNGSPVPLH